MLSQNFVRQLSIGNYKVYTHNEQNIWRRKHFVAAFLPEMREKGKIFSLQVAFGSVFSGIIPCIDGEIE